MKALSKAVIADYLINQVSLSKPQAQELLEQFFEAVKSSLESGENVKLSGFGNFNLRDKPKRPGRNPKTGEEIPVAERRVVTFKPGLKLKKKVDTRD